MSVLFGNIGSSSPSSYTYSPRRPSFSTERGVTTAGRLAMVRRKPRTCAHHRA